MTLLPFVSSQVSIFDFIKTNSIGGDSLPLRAPYEKMPVTFDNPSHTLFITCNEPPVLERSDAMTRRIVIISFNQRFARAQVMRRGRGALSNAQKLLLAQHSRETAFAPTSSVDIDRLGKSPEFKRQFLRWIVHGAIKYNRGGLQEPDCVVEEMDNYWTSNDPLARFINDRCDVCDTQAQSWQSHARGSGEYEELVKFRLELENWMSYNRVHKILVQYVLKDFTGQLQRFGLPVVHDVTDLIGKAVILGVSLKNNYQ